jgi:hypothetical protein
VPVSGPVNHVFHEAKPEKYYFYRVADKGRETTGISRAV